MRPASIALGLAACALAAALLPSRTANAISLLPVNDAYSVAHDRRLDVPAPGVLANDIGLLGGESAVLDSSPDHGELDLNSDGSFTYDPDPGYVGTDTFTYHPTGLLVLPATVTITIVNRAPVASDDAYTAATGVEKRIPPPGVLANDQDADGDDLVAVLVDGGGNGSLDLASDGSFTFKSGGSFVGVREFTYRAWDGLAWSAVATVRITVGPAATPTPTPAPTPTPTPSRTPSPLPLPTLPLPTLPLPTLPLPTVGPTPAPTASPTRPPDPSPTPPSEPTTSASPSARPPAPSPRPDPTAAPGGLGGGPGNGPGDPGDPDSSGSGGGASQGGFAVGSSDTEPPDVSLGGALVGFDAAVEFAVPTLVLTVPGLLLVLAVLAQGLVGAVWLPVVRRWLGGFGLTRRRRRDTAAPAERLTPPADRPILPATSRMNGL
jgi:hypothetical protein